jgi:hypothetical protein
LWFLGNRPYDFRFLPLYVFCGERLLVSYLRESNIDSANLAWVILALLVKALRQRWPEVKITLRADSSFCRWKMLRWCEPVGINYIVGLAKNERLQALSAKFQRRAERSTAGAGARCDCCLWGCWLNIPALTAPFDQIAHPIDAAPLSRFPAAGGTNKRSYHEVLSPDFVK